MVKVCLNCGQEMEAPGTLIPSGIHTLEGFWCCTQCYAQYDEKSKEKT